MINIDRPSQIFYLIAISSTPVTSSALSEAVNTSIRTIKKDMNSVRVIAAKSGCELIAQRGIGYSLHIFDDRTFSKVVYQLKIRTSYALGCKDHETSTGYYAIMQYMISQDGYFKIEDIEESFFVSRQFVSEVIRYFKKFIRAYNLRLISKPNYGNIVIGSEFNLRLAMIELFDIHFHDIEVSNRNSSFLSYFESSRSELSIYRQTLLRTLRKHDYQIHDDFSQRLARFLVLQHKRNSAGFCTPYQEINQAFISKFTLQKDISQEILESLTDQLGNTYTNEDILSLSMLILLWTDTPCTAYFKRFYKPIMPGINRFYESFADFNKSYTGIDIRASHNLKQFLFGKIASLLIHATFSANLFDYNVADFMDRNITNPMGQILAESLLRFFETKENTLFSTYISEKLEQDCALYVCRTEKAVPINILISSAKGLDGAINIRQYIKNTFNTQLIGNIKVIELYEGRSIDTKHYDLMILDRLDSVFYAYDWPYISIDFSNNSASQIIFKKISEISQVLNQINVSKYIREFEPNSDKNHNQIKIGSIDITRKTSYIYNPKLPANTYYIRSKKCIFYNFTKDLGLSLHDLNVAFELALSKSNKTK